MRTVTVTSETIAAYFLASRSARSFASRACTAGLGTRAGGAGRDSSEPRHSWCSHGPSCPASSPCALRPHRHQGWGMVRLAVQGRASTSFSHCTSEPQRHASQLENQLTATHLTQRSRGTSGAHSQGACLRDVQMSLSPLHGSESCCARSVARSLCSCDARTEQVQHPAAAVRS